MKQLERRVAKLERSIPPSNDTDDEIGKLLEFLRTSERKELIHIMEALLTLMQQAAPENQIALAQESYDAAQKKFADRSATRRERYPVLFLSICKYGEGPAVRDPWSAEREIEALRNASALKWEERGLALILDALTPVELGIFDQLRGHLRCQLGNWHGVRNLVTSPDQIPIEKVWFYARLEKGGTGSWLDVGRQLTWADLKLDPAEFNRRAA